MGRINDEIRRFCMKHYRLSQLIAAATYPRYKDSRNMKNAMDIFLDPSLSEKEKKKIRIELYANMFTYRIAYGEYFVFNFPELDDRGKRTFIGNEEAMDLFAGLGTEQSKKIFNDKYETYLWFGKYYGRELIRISGEDDRERFYEFLKKHGTVLIKPVGLNAGKGIFAADTAAEEFSRERLFDRILELGECVAEEKITQSRCMADFHPESVNTVRLSTYTENGRTVPLFAFFRTGRGKSVVDNGGSGGVFASVDVGTGTVTTDGADEFGHDFPEHPDTGRQFKGFEIPRWKDLLSLSEILAGIVPEQKYVGWDFALTDQGWILVEGNTRGQFLHQYCEKKGCRKAIESVIH